MSRTTDRHTRFTQFAFGTAAFLFVVVIVWIDIATPFWKELVVLSGFAGAILSSLFTYFIVNRAVTRQNTRRWAPMIRLGLTEFLHELVDDEHSDTGRGILVSRTVPAVEELTVESLEALQPTVADERTQLATSLSSWAEILSSSGDNDTLLLYIADLAVHLQLILDVSVDIEKQLTTAPSEASLNKLNVEISNYNSKVRAAVDEIRDQLDLLPTTVINLETGSIQTQRPARKTHPADSQ